MKLSEFPLLSSELLQFVCDDIPNDWQDGDEMLLQALDGDYLIRKGDYARVGKILGRQDRIAMQVQRGRTLWILGNRRANVLHLQSLDLVEQFPLDMAIAVDEAITEDLVKRGEISGADMPSAVAWLNECFVCESISGMGRIFIARFDNVSDTSFVLIGAGWSGAVKRDGATLKLMSVTRLKAKPDQIAMLAGKISFQDASVAVRLQSTEQQALLDAALRDNGSYLRLWKEYGELEWKQARDCARDLGSLRYREARLVEGERWAWFLKTDAEELREFKKRWRGLGLSGSTQVELGENSLDLDFYIEDLQEKTDRARQRSVRGELEFEKDGVVLILSQDRRSKRPPAKGFLYYSLAGEETVQKRRVNARQSIKAGRRLPQLSYLLEGVAPPIARQRRLDGLSAYAKACFKNGVPTERQKRALDVAINTPDIALIVGPPGTGKTQVIAALQRRLAEILGVEQSALQHQVLISSYQHDAVDNALNRAEVFGLPAVRIGGRQQRDGGGVNPVSIWCENKRREIFDKLEAIKRDDPLTPHLTELDRRITILRLASLSPMERQDHFEQIDKLLQQLRELGIRLSTELQDRWDEFLAQQAKIETQRGNQAPASLPRLIRALRTTAVGFADDGSDRVYQLERTLRRDGVTLEESEWEMLHRLSCTVDANERDLCELAEFKDSMLERLSPDYRPPRIKHILSGEALGILAEMEQAINAPLRRSRRGITAIVADYHAALAQAPKEAERAVREYASIVGATCQQSAGTAMSNLKELSNQDVAKIEFDTVVIDEAARANPLDLFVPMSMARRRIVLVGDHRQLPHLVQRDLEDELISRQSLSEAQAKAYEQSLFERLVKQLAEQEKVDNIKRVVMLDTQYRMHPTLGDFISRQFYEPEGLGVLRSGRPASDFAHAISGYEGKCAAWLNVPLSDGNEERSGSSRVRQAEARVIAREVKRIADSCGPALSIGVISFYRAQCDCILDAFKEKGLAEEDGGEIRIARAYLQTDSGDERLRVGTVDAFQGKEFDLVFLSIVRANAIVTSNKKESIEQEKLLNDKYGHLRLANRMNVAMSRQRKLLVAVGDKGMVEAPGAEEAIPALVAFLTLCGKESANVR
jgi:DNA polymerase III delta prime subunit